MPKISIIMPSLNISKYITECIESVINQTLKDIEIIAIDAGSTDGTLEILKEYALRDKRIQIINSEKKSYGYQLNLGISLAQGEYVGVVETDDYIVPNMYEVLYNTALKNNVDYAKGYAEQFYTIDQNEKYTVKSNTFYIEEGISNVVVNPSTMPELFIKDRFLWLGIYKREFLKNIRLNETAGAAFQDVGFQLQILINATRAIYIDKPVYFYRQDNNNSSIYNKKSFNYIVNEYKINKQYIINKSKEWHTAFYVRMFDQTNNRFNVMARSGFFWNDAISDIDIIREELMKAVDNKYLSKKIMGSKRWKKLQLFFLNEQVLYNENLEKYKQTVIELKKLLNFIGDNHVIIFGVGNYGTFLYRLLEKKGKKIIAFCDNNKDIQNTKVHNIQVFSPDVVASTYPNGIFILTSPKYSNDMKKQLLEQNIHENQIIEYKLGKSVLLMNL